MILTGILAACVANGGTTAGNAPTIGSGGVPPAPTSDVPGDSNTAISPDATEPNGAVDSNMAHPIAPLIKNTPFVSVGQDANGRAQLFRDGQPFYMLGYQGELPDVTNYCGWTGDQMLAAFADMHTGGGANTVRLWFLQSAGGPGDWSAFDRAIAAAKANNLSIVATLVNQWGDCEPQVNGVKNYKTVAWYETGYKQAGDGYPLSYHDFAQAVAQRYAGETAIALWQLVNESEARDPTSDGCPSESAAAAAIRAFADDMADLLHTTDPNHIVNLGTQDNAYCGTSGTNYQFVQAGKVDLCETHSYEPGNVAVPPLVAQNVALCRAINKPTFMGEVGICRGAQADGTCASVGNDTTLQQRATFFQQKLAAAGEAGLSGMLIWQYSANELDADFGVFPGDSLQSVMLQAPR